MKKYKIDYCYYRLARSKEELEASKDLLNKNGLLTSLSSSYYSIFHAMRAVLILDDFDSKTHKSVISFFNEKYLKTKIFPVEFAKIIGQAFEKRMLADYKDFFIVVNDDVKKQHENAELFYQTIEKFIVENYPMPLKLKVCGMRESQNIKDLLKFAPDYMGFIFYEKSPRNASEVLDENILMHFPQTTLKTGVFVNASLEFINEKIEKFQLDALQLHGNESPEFCKQLKINNIQIIKAFSVDETFDFGQLTDYENAVDYFLFDTKGINHGGNGVKFNWKILETATINKPFFLSGGVDLEDMEEIQLLKSKVKNFFALDVNSKFETSPGLKNVDKIEKLTQLLYI